MSVLLILITEEIINEGEIHTLAYDWLIELEKFYLETGQNWKLRVVKDHLSERRGITEAILKNIATFNS